MKYIKVIALFSLAYYGFVLAETVFNSIDGNTAHFPVSQIEDLFALAFAASLTALYCSKWFNTVDGSINKAALVTAIAPVVVPLVTVVMFLVFAIIIGDFQRVLVEITAHITSTQYLLQILVYRLPALVLVFFFTRYYLKQIGKGNQSSGL